MGLSLAAWLHVDAYASTSRYYIAAAAALLLATSICRALCLLHINLSLASLTKGGPTNTTRITAKRRGENLIEMSVVLPTDCTVLPGQHIYLRVLPISWIQSHPFTVLSTKPMPVNTELKEITTSETNGKPDVEKAENGSTARKKNDAKTNFLLLAVRPQNGLTAKLLPAFIPKNGDSKEHGDETILQLSGIIDGPYGLNRNLGEYSTVLMIGTGTGMFALIPHIQKLLEGFDQGNICTRKLKVVWQVEDSACLNMSHPLMDAFLSEEIQGQEDNPVS